MKHEQAVTVKLAFSKLTIFVAVLATALSIIYLYEKNQDTTAFFTYYGSIPAKTTFYSPEPIKSMSFGYSANGQGLDMKFVNQLWCKPLDSSSIKFDLIATRALVIEDFNELNQIDGIFMKAISKTTTLSQIGIHDAEVIRTNGKQYAEWSLDDIRPLIDSVCYVNSDVSTETKLFRLEKHIHFDGSLFDYYVDPE